MAEKLSIETRRRLNEEGYHVSSLWQPPSLFKPDGRKLKNVAQPGDPWVAQLFYPADGLADERPVPWWPMCVEIGRGETADEAVADAMNKGKEMEGRLRKLEGALGHLTEALHVFRTGHGRS